MTKLPAVYRVNRQSVSKKKSKTSTILTKPSSKSCLSELQSKYVMVPIDKAANNIAFVCKRYYALVILKELGLIGTSTSTYTSIDDITPEDIIQKHRNELKQQYDIIVEDNMFTLPDIYWLPKLHKNPVGFRFIIASKHCTIKQLSKNISSAFSLFQKQINAYHTKTHFYSGIKTYWIVQNRDPILNAVKKSTIRRSAKCISSFDFSTLYTKIPHNKLIDVLTNIIDFVFKGGTRDKVSVNSSGKAKWANDKKDSFVFTKESIKSAITYLIKNSYFKFGGKLFRQDIGIPMGSDPAPAFANLFLFHYESNWINSIRKNNGILSRKFGQVFRYIDDLLALNDGKSFEAYYKDIYPEELQLNKENDGYTNSTFLDLDIRIENGIFTTKLFDKRNNFGFRITRLPFRDSNIPCKMFYSSIAAECIRICRATSTAHYATLSIRSLVTRMRDQGANISMVKNCISRALQRHNMNIKMGYRNNEFVNQLFPYCI